jgi:hypothetical protein
MAFSCPTLSVPFRPIRSCFSPLNANMHAFLIWMLSPTEMQPICSFQRQSLIVPVASPITALVTTALFPNRVYTYVGSGISRTIALRLTCLIPTRKPPIKLDRSASAFLAKYLRILSQPINFLRGLPLSARLSCAFLSRPKLEITCQGQHYTSLKEKRGIRPTARSCISSPLFPTVLAITTSRKTRNAKYYGSAPSLKNNSSSYQAYARYINLVQIHHFINFSRTSLIGFELCLPVLFLQGGNDDQARRTSYCVPYVR